MQSYFIKQKTFYDSVEDALPSQPYSYSYGDRPVFEFVFLLNEIAEGDLLVFAIDNDMIFYDSASENLLHSASCMVVVRHDVTAEEATAGKVQMRMETRTRKFRDVVNGKVRPVEVISGLYRKRGSDDDINYALLAKGRAFANGIIADYDALPEPITTADEFYSKTETDNLLDAKADKTDLVAHTDNSAIHVTLQEKTAWNSKADRNDIGDATVTITQGGVSKGAFSVNATNDVTIDLNDGGVQADWAEADSSSPAYIQNKPNLYTKEETDSLLNAKADKATTLAGYGITDAYTKTEVDAKVSSVYRYRGTVSTYAGLPVSDQQIGDVYNIETADAEHGIKAGDNVAWNGTAWDVLAGEIDLSAYATKAELATVATTGNYNDLTNKPDLNTKLDAPATAGTVGQVLTKTESGQAWADAKQYTLTPATKTTLGGVKIGDNLTITEDGTLSADVQDNVVEHLSALPESWETSDNGRVFVWEADSTETLSKGHIYKVNTVETASGILMQLTPPAGFPEDFASLANKASGLYTPYDTVEGSSGGNVRAYTRYKNPNGYWLAPYISGGNFTNMWMFTNNPSGNTDTATDYTSASISADKTSLTAADLTSATWSKNFMNSMQSKSFTDVAGGVSADFEDLTPESTVDIPIASTSTLGGIKVGSRLSIDSNGVLSADEQSSSYTLPVASTSTLGGVKVNNSTGALNVASDGLLALLVSAPEAMKTGSTGIAMNLKANGGLMFQTVTYGDPTKALGMSPKATYNQLSGSSVTITPSVQPYKLTASGATTLNSSYSFGINDGVVSTGDIAYAEIVIVLGASGSITAGMDLTLVDALTAGKTNYCVVRWDGEKAKLFVWRVE